MTEQTQLTQTTTLLKADERKPIRKTLFNPIIWTLCISIALYIVGFALALDPNSITTPAFLYFGLRYVPLAVLVVSTILSIAALVRKDKKAQILSIVVILVFFFFIVV